MRTLTLIIIVTFLCLSSQGQKRISTKELASIADTFGVDSALSIIHPFIDISEIDTSVALSIALKCSDLRNYSSQLSYFSDVGQRIKNEPVNAKAIDNLRTYRKALSDSTTDGYKIFVIPDQIFHILIFQNNPSIIPILKSEFEFWEHKADSIRNKYPSALKRFFQKFKGIPPSEQTFSDCKENSFKLAWILNKFGASEFSIERVNAIKKQLVPYLRDYNMERHQFKGYQLKSDIIELQKSYSAIDEIDFANEMELIKLNENLEGEKCWKQLITNDKLGLYEIGCQWAPLAGRGKTIRLELINQTKLKVTVVSSWIS